MDCEGRCMPALLKDIIIYNHNDMVSMIPRIPCDDFSRQIRKTDQEKRYGGFAINKET